MVTLSPFCKGIPPADVTLVLDKSKCIQNNPSIDSWKKGVIWVKLSKEVGLDTFVISTVANRRRN